jgi:O-antigen/teichoic acid export membrane protein
MIKMERMLRASAGITTLCSGLVFGLLFIAGEGLSRLLFGAYFSGNWDIMMILSAGWLFHVWAGSGGFVLNMTDNQKSVMVINIFSGAVTLVLGYWLTSRYGGLGMAIASSIGLLLVNSLMLIRIRKKLGIRIYAGMSGVTEVINDISRRLQAVR